MHTDYGHMIAKSLILCVQIQILIRNKYLGFGYKGLSSFSCRNNGWFMEKIGQGTHNIKMGAKVWIL